MGFEFAQQHLIEICGKQYPVDISDPAFIEGVVSNFAAITDRYNAFLGLRAELAAGGDLTTAAVKALSERLIAENTAIAEHGRAFIVKALGQSAYDDIFAGRKATAADHIELCAYVYREAIRSREEAVTAQLNRRARRAAKRASKGAHGLRAFLPHTH